MSYRERILNCQRGASLVEYILLAASIFLVCLAGIANMGTDTGKSLNETASKIEEATPY